MNSTDLLIQDLQQRHLAIIEANNWEETPESRELARQFNALPLHDVGECWECGGKASITCQYH